MFWHSSIIQLIAITFRRLLIEDRLKNLEDQQLLLSDIDRDVNSPHEAQQEAADSKLRKLLIEILGIKEWESLSLDEVVEPTEETSLFFSLYRIREKNIQIRDISIQLLLTHPHRSYAIVRYLTLFRGDSLVFDALWDVIHDTSKHGQVRANCLRGIYELTDDLDSIRPILRDWINSTDLSLSLCAIEIIQQFPDEKQFLMDISKEIAAPHLLYAIISTVFILVDSDDERLKLIHDCLNSNDYMILALGTYFLSTRIHLISHFIAFQNSLAGDLITSIRNSISVTSFTKNLQALFGIQHVSEQLANLMPDLRDLNQLVINMILSKETNRDEYLRNLTEFLVKFSRFYQKSIGKQFASLIDDNADIKRAFEYTKVGLMNLSDFKSSLTFLGTKPALGYIDAEILHDGISQVIDNAFIEIIELIEKTPDTLQFEGLETSEPVIPMIFFSYSHDDDKKRTTLKKKLKFLEIQGLAKLWSDRQIPSGGVWSAEIEEKLNASKIVLFLITSNFTGSEFIYEEEIPRSIANYEARVSVCIPVILEDCIWKFPPLEHLQAIPQDAKAITLWTRPDSAYKDIQSKVLDVLSMLENNTYVWRDIPD